MRIPVNYFWGIIKKFIFFILGSVIFGLVYTQAPLYTSNQNQYFLHGFAAAGVGELNADWLASTGDPTPVFSLLVRLLYSAFHWDILFYLIFGLLAGIYLFATIDIVLAIFPATNSRFGKTCVFAAILFAHSAAIRFLLSRVLDGSWTYILEEGFAGQRVLGTVLQPSVFGVFLTLSLALFLRRKQVLAILCVAVAATVHPTYLLAAGILTGAYIAILFVEAWGKPVSSRWDAFREAFLLGGLAFLLVLPIAAYMISLVATSPLDVSAQAQEILVRERIPFHALISVWWGWPSIANVLLITVALFLIRKTRFFWMMLLPSAGIAILILAQLYLQNNALALLFPWRLSVVIAPLATSLILGRLIALFVNWPLPKGLLAERVVYGIMVIGVIGLMSLGIARMKLDSDEKAAEPALPAMQWVKENKKPGETYLIPIKMDSFRLITGAPAYVDYKSIPYKPEDVLEWVRRIKFANMFYQPIQQTNDFQAAQVCQKIPLLRAEGITHILIDSDIVFGECDAVKMVFHNPSYQIFEIVLPCACQCCSIDK